MLIVIEGCVGAGKSTVAQGLAASRRSKLLLEDFDRNPFLQAFYQNPLENATETEFAFLLLHFHQLKNQSDAASRSEVIADFHLGKDLLYANLNLKDRRFKSLFAELYQLCLETIPRPALMIFLSAPTDLLVDRIRQRKRDFELGIDPEYYAGVNAAYEEYFEEYNEKKMRISMDDWDFVKDPSLYNRLGSLVDGELNSK
jgi:deoxyadenosine/deoxycytidine kinase